MGTSRSSHAKGLQDLSPSLVLPFLLPCYAAPLPPRLIYRSPPQNCGNSSTPEGRTNSSEQPSVPPPSPLPFRIFASRSSEFFLNPRQGVHIPPPLPLPPCPSLVSPHVQGDSCESAPHPPEHSQNRFSRFLPAPLSLSHRVGT